MQTVLGAKVVLAVNGVMELSLNTINNIWLMISNLHANKMQKDIMILMMNDAERVKIYFLFTYINEKH